MPGFGDDSFGDAPFGDSDWAKEVLFDLLPEVYRNLDQAQGGLLEAFTDGAAGEYRVLKAKIEDLDKLRLPSGTLTRYDGMTQVVLGVVIPLVGTVLASGTNGMVDAFGTFSANTIRFSKKDVGRSLTMSSTNSSVPTNIRFQCVITSVQSSTSVLVQPLPNQDTNVAWTLTEVVEPPTTTRIEVFSGDVSGVVPGMTLFDGATQFKIVDRDVFPDYLEGGKVLEREGVDGVIDTAVAPSGFPSLGLYSASAFFSTVDVGRTLSVPASPTDGNAQQYFVTSTYMVGTGPYTGQTVATLVPINPQPAVIQVADPASQGLYWALLKKPSITIQGTILPVGVMYSRGSPGYAVPG